MGVMNTGVIDLVDIQLVTYLAEKKPGGSPYLDMESIWNSSTCGFPPGCRKFRVHVWYEGELSVDSVTDWVATSILSLPRIRIFFRRVNGSGFSAEKQTSQYNFNSLPNHFSCKKE
ncbi:hypothetical protein HAX54_025880 [Datura stramonium]|uniref:Uncharacterized protein n=1 Tax=Datura stramonium TaxID=4076 RepID=A0ABS8V0B6_DATST|nr:hypothetical protein [Datura stramonium]